MDISYRLYGFLLLAYPPEFRREFGTQMLQVFRDCYRAETRNGSVARFWFRTLLDLILTASRERIDSGRESAFMSDKRTDVMALLSSIAIIVVALILHYLARSTPGSSLLAIGYFLDALITTGVLGNLILFVLLKTTKLNALRAAIWVFGVIHVALLLFIMLVFSRADPVFNSGGVLLGYAFSFVFWVGLHWAWRIRRRIVSHE